MGMKKLIISTVIFFAITAGLILLILFFAACWRWFEIHTGTVNESGPYYGFWSGFGSDLGEASLIAVVITGAATAYHKAECHDPTCHRIGMHPTHDGMFHLCRRHHPDLEHLAGGKPSLDFIHAHHHRARREAGLTTYSHPAERLLAPRHEPPPTKARASTKKIAPKR